MKVPTLKELEAFALKYERVISPITLAIGFTIDYLTLRRIDLLPGTILLYAYLSVLGLSILFLHLAESGVLPKRFTDAVKPFAPMTLQYAIGGLMSAFLIFYSTSGTLARSWPFIVFLVLIAIGTEFFRRYHERLIFQASILYLSIFSFSIFAVPLFMNEIGPRPFLIAGAVSVAVIAVFLTLLSVAGYRRFRASVMYIAQSIFVIYVSMNVLYFTNVLPPLPLSMKEIGVYHNVVVDQGEYALEGESIPWYTRFVTRDAIHLAPSEPVYVFSSVFAPVDINTDITHHWEYWSERESDWVTSSTISFPVSGGRDGGYRGFSLKSAVFPGLWRVSVETPQGALIGRMTFMIENAGIPVELVEIRR